MSGENNVGGMKGSKWKVGGDETRVRVLERWKCYGSIAIRNNITIIAIIIIVRVQRDTLKLWCPAVG